jgi:multidrug resistance efflux pump
MKAFFDQIEHLFGIRLEAYFPYIIAGISLFFFFNLKQQISSLQAQVAQVEGAQNMTSSLSKSDLVPLTQSINLANDRLARVQAETTAIAAQLPDLESGLSLANQKLTYLENQKDGKGAPTSPAAAENKPAPLH